MAAGFSCELHVYHCSRLRKRLYRVEQWRLHDHSCCLMSATASLLFRPKTLLTRQSFIYLKRQSVLMVLTFSWRISIAAVCVSRVVGGIVREGTRRSALITDWSRQAPLGCLRSLHLSGTTVTCASEEDWRAHNTSHYVK